MKKQYDITVNEIAAWLSVPGEAGPTAADISRGEADLLAYARAHARPAPPALRQTVLDKIARLRQIEADRRPLDLERLPLLDESCNWLDWAEVVSGIEPPADFANIHLHPLVADAERELFVVWVKEYIDQEKHDNMLESVLLLEGSCECHFISPDGDHYLVRLSQGDFISMPLGHTHDLIITSSEPAKGILQWLKRAA